MKLQKVIVSMLCLFAITTSIFATSKLTETLVTTWDGFDWVNQSKMVYEYPSDNQQVMTHYVELTGEWDPVQRITTTYDNQNNPTAMTMEMYMQGAWQSISDMTMVNTYDGNQLEQVEITTNLFLKSRDLYTYEDGKLTERLGQVDYGTGWEDTDRNTYHYSGSNLDYMTNEEFDGSSWNFLIKSEYHYANSRRDYIVSYEWNETDWEKSTIRYYDYNADGTVSMEHVQYWDGTNYSEGDKHYHTYGSTPVARNNKASVESFALNNYPNPFNPETNIQFNLDKNSTVALEVFDVQGRKINTLIANENKQAGVYSVKWNGMNSLGKTMPSGVYIYRLTSDQIVISKHCILLK